MTNNDTTRTRAAAILRGPLPEAALAGLGGLAATILLKVTVLRDLRHSLPKDLADPVLVSWILSWGGHGLVNQPLQIWHANAFWPLRSSLAFTDSLLGLSPLGALFGDGVEAALLRYNVMFLLAYALAFAGAYLLARQLGCGRTGAAVAGLGYAFAPWHLAQEGHLHVLFNGAVPLSLALLARGHGYGRGGGVRPGFVLAGWLVAAWQVSIGWGIGLPFAYVLAVIGVVVLARWLLQRRRDPAAAALPRDLVVMEVGGIICFLLIAVGFAVPYLNLSRAYPEAVRTVGDVEIYSPPLQGLVTAPAESHVWGDLQAGLRESLPFQPEMTLSPGIMLLLLAGVGAAAGAWPARRRLAVLTGTLVLLILALGTRFAGGHVTYLLLFEYLPGWQSIRTPGRLVIFATLGLALLAATGVDRVGGRAPVVPARRALAVALGALVLLESWGTTPIAEPPPLPAALDHAEGPVLVLPADGFVADGFAMLYSTEGFYPLVNGSSGFTPPLSAEIRRQAESFPDHQSVMRLRELGVRTVVLLPQRTDGTPWQDAATKPTEGLGLVVESVGDALVYRL